MHKSLFSLASGAAVLLAIEGTVPVYADVQLPENMQRGAAPVPGAPPPGMPQAVRASSAYSELPLTPEDAQMRIDELKELAGRGSKQELQEKVMELTEWLTDMAEAHLKLASSFAKSDATAGARDTEKQAAKKFSQLKNQTLLLKADLLIKQQRYPEALAPLVDIVVAEPQTTTGQAAYQRLKEIGFCQEPEYKLQIQPKNTAPQKVKPAASQHFHVLSCQSSIEKNESKKQSKAK